MTYSYHRLDLNGRLHPTLVANRAERDVVCRATAVLDRARRAPERLPRPDAGRAGDTGDAGR